jgi:hypothetical protein
MKMFCQNYPKVAYSFWAWARLINVQRFIPILPIENNLQFKLPILGCNSIPQGKIQLMLKTTVPHTPFSRSGISE